MPRLVDIQPGGEKYLAFALSKLRLLKAWMKPAGLRVMSKHFWVNSTDKIWIKALDLGNDVWWDWIRIEAGGGLWDFYADGISVRVAKIAGTLRDTALSSILLTSRTFGRSWILSTIDSQLKVLDPEEKVSRVRDGQYDTGYTHELFSATPKGGAGWGAVSLKSGAHRHFYAADKQVAVPLTGFNSHGITATGTDMFYGRKETSLDSVTAYDLDGGSVTHSVGGTIINLPKPTWYDALISAAAGLELSIKSAKLGTLHTAAPIVATSFTPDVLEVASSRSKIYLWTSGEAFDAGGNPFFTWYAAVAVFDSVFNLDTGALIGYAANTDVLASAVGDSGESLNLLGGAVGPVATQSDSFAVVQKSLLSGDTVDIVSASGNAVNIGNAAVYALVSTPNKMWLLAKPFGGDPGLYDQNGLVRTFPSLSLPAVVIYAGRMGDDAFFRVETGVNQWQLIGSDGTNVDIRTGLPAGFAAGPGTGGHVWRSDLNGAHWVWSGTIPNPADPPVPATVPYVFSRDTSPLGVAAAFKSYDLPATETLSAVNTPANSSIYLVEDLED